MESLSSLIIVTLSISIIQLKFQNAATRFVLEHVTPIYDKKGD